MAILEADVLAVKRYIAKNKDSLNALDDAGFPALSYAVFVGSVDIVKMLLDAGADASVRDATQNSVLHIAAGYGHVQVLKEILERGGPEGKAGLAQWVNDKGQTVLDAARVGEAAPPFKARMLQFIAEENCVKLEDVLGQKDVAMIKQIIENDEEENEDSMLGIFLRKSIKNGASVDPGQEAKANDFKDNTVHQEVTEDSPRILQLADELPGRPATAELPGRPAKAARTVD